MITEVNQYMYNFYQLECFKIIPSVFIIIQETISINANIKRLSIYIANIIQSLFYQLEFLEVIHVMLKIIQVATEQARPFRFSPYNVN